MWAMSRAARRKRNLPAPVVPTDLTALHERPADLRITWIGHSSFYVQMAGLRILLDPVFSERASPFSFLGPRRAPRLPFEIDDLPPIDLVLISHDHYDHLDKQAVRQLVEAGDPQFLVPLGVERIVRSFGARRVAEFDWWQYTNIDGLGIHCLPARHFSGRGLHNRNGTLWASWYIDSPAGRLYFAGDSGYGSHYETIRDSVGAPDVVIMPIGAYLPRWIMEPVHVSPEEALQAVRDLSATQVVPCHWGTFDLAEEPIQEPMEQLKRLTQASGEADRIVQMSIGETRVFRTAAQEASTRSPSS